MPDPVSADPPKGLELLNDATGWYLAGTPSWAGLYAITLRVLDSNNKNDTTTLALRVRYENGIAIENRALPDALYDTDYRTQLTASGGVVPLKWELGCPVVRDAAGNYSPTCVQKLPEPFAITSEGVIFGRKNLNAGDRADPLTFNFLIKVTDAECRTDLRAFSLTLRKGEPVPEAAQGCGCTAAGPAALFLATLAGLSVATRRRRPRKNSSS